MLHQIDFYKIISPGKFDKPFYYQSSCIVDMYWYRLFLIKTSFGTIKKINIHIVNNNTPKNYSTQVKTININFDSYKYNSLDKHNKKKMILDTIHENLLQIADDQQIDKEKLQQAYNYCIENNLENKWLLGGKLKRSASKKYYGTVECYWDTELFQATVIIYDIKKNELFRTELFKVTFDKPIGYLGYIYRYKPLWEVDKLNNECLVLDIGNIFLKDQVNIKKWFINPENQEIQTVKRELISNP